MQPVTIAGAALGAVVGAALWTAISYFTGYEVGFVAWIIGGLVGGLAAATGGHGSASGVLCAVLAVASIFGGKIAATHFLVQKEIDEIVESSANEDVYQDWVTDAEDFKAVEGRSEYAAFMIEHEFHEATTPSGVSGSDIADFERYVVPRLREIGTEPPMTYEVWRTSERDRYEGIAEDFDLVSAVTDSLGLFDIVFALLGIGTAFRLGSGQE